MEKKTMTKEEFLELLRNRRANMSSKARSTGSGESETSANIFETLKEKSKSDKESFAKLLESKGFGSGKAKAVSVTSDTVDGTKPKKSAQEMLDAAREHFKEMLANRKNQNDNENIDKKENV